MPAYKALLARAAAVTVVSNYIPSMCEGAAESCAGSLSLTSALDHGTAATSTSIKQQRQQQAVPAAETRSDRKFEK